MHCCDGGRILLQWCFTAAVLMLPQHAALQRKRLLLVARPREASMLYLQETGKAETLCGRH